MDRLFSLKPPVLDIAHEYYYYYYYYGVYFSLQNQLVAITWRFPLAVKANNLQVKRVVARETQESPTGTTSKQHYTALNVQGRK